MPVPSALCRLSVCPPPLPDALVQCAKASRRSSLPHLNLASASQCAIEQASNTLDTTRFTAFRPSLGCYTPP